MGKVVLKAGLTLASLLTLECPAFSSTDVNEKFNIYANMGAMTICFLNALDVSFDKAMQASSTAMMRTLVDHHSSELLARQLGRTPTEEEIREASVVQLAVRTHELCGDKFEGANRIEMDRVLRLIRDRYSPR